MTDKQTEDAKPVSFKQLGNELGMKFSAIRRSVTRYGFVPFRFSEGINQPLYLSAADAAAFQMRVMQKRNNALPTESIKVARVSGVYVIEVPSFSGGVRVKVGWSDSVPDRLATYKTIIPDLHVLGVWNTSDSWCEKAALKCADANGRKVYQELFEFDDVDGFIADLSSLFASMGMMRTSFT